MMKSFLHNLTVAVLGLPSRRAPNSSARPGSSSRSTPRPRMAAFRSLSMESNGSGSRSSTRPGRRRAYLFEVLAIDKSGNQTITEGSFNTGP